MTRIRLLTTALALFLAAFLAVSSAGADEARGMDFRTYLSLQRDMTEGQVLSIAGAPDLVSDEGMVRSPGRELLVLKTYTYLPTAADPYVTTVTLLGGRVTEIRRDRKS
jgi:hypothetical protein